jgi:predicted hydrocarbon binding protein
LLEDASFGLKTQAAFVRGLPKALRRKPALEMLAKLIGGHTGDITVHTLDLDLLVVDHASPAAQAQTADEPICFVTLGMIQECLYWAVGQVHDVEERACRALGNSQCEFKITIGG